MSASCLAARMGELIALSPAERAALDRLEARERPLRRGSALVREKEHSSELFILRQGVTMSYLLLENGGRQILRFQFPGDMVGMAALAYRDSPETVVALTDCVVAPIERAQWAQLLVDHPRLSAVVMAMNQMERTALTDRLAALGRTSARARIAALLLEIRNRLRTVNRTITTTFALGLTQEEVGDATGLTAVHVNRMLRQLESEGLIAREGGRITLVGEAALTREASYVDRSDSLDFSWLPPAR